MYVAIEVEQLAKVYTGGTEALRDVSFHVEEGEIFTYLGPNGSGKTTTARILTGLMRPTGGRARVAGVDVVSRPEDVRSRIGAYWGGMQRPPDLAAALGRRPEVLFLDEPTTGLDPQSRRALWDEIRRLRSEGITVFLTTRDREEAEALADRLAVVHEGRIVALGSPEMVWSQLGGTAMQPGATPAEGGRAVHRLAHLVTAD